ncbi:MAG: AbrB/MazE/SpoVT family DNA-binding domain-containing protein [Sphingomonas sp.]|nr:AbrB/MazE/SpoVT family DNA-binding domain-containing protein [Sphingomonas sp.]
MATVIKASSKGQVVLPKRTRDRLGIDSGTLLEVIETATGVELRPLKQSGLTADEATARLREIVRYTGPRLDEADWQRGIELAIQKKWGKRSA